ncbi:choice-of-anchor E domain-containing protein [Rudanella paleaurantiibacter]|uniref:Choice-of-anchor E domain-containing protein n=1 Tax=Rudanella paleaurantiibacter TaxID=2614655 RepID=A0A7J5TUH5_9BACT|nr:choice-of-anchor E domain-containing protein [Rudanella paleaurantiibacter]KAB7727309.1 choice-of-anchor E domain-containing protein [Rudanella paleaurantiibacter]
MKKSLFLLFILTLALCTAGSGLSWAQCTSCVNTAVTGGSYNLTGNQTLCITGNVGDFNLNVSGTGNKICVASGATWTIGFGLNFNTSLTIDVYGTINANGSYNVNGTGNQAVFNIKPGATMNTNTPGFGNSIRINNEGTLNFTNTGAITNEGSFTLINATTGIVSATATTLFKLGTNSYVENDNLMTFSNLENAESDIRNAQGATITIGRYFFNHGNIINDGQINTICGPFGSVGCEFIVGDKGPGKIFSISNTGCMSVTGTVTFNGPGFVNGTLEVTGNLTINKPVSGANGRIIVNNGVSTISLSGAYNGTNMAFCDKNTAGNVFDVVQANNPSTNVVYTVDCSPNLCASADLCVAPSNLTLTAVPGTPAPGATVTLGVSASNTTPGSTSYTWSGSGISSPTATTVASRTLVAPATAGVYTYTVLVSNGTGCTATATRSVTVVALVDGCPGNLLSNGSLENGNFNNFTTSNPSISGTLMTYGGSQSVFLSADPGGNTLPDTPITGFRANTGYWVDATTNGGLGAKDANRLFAIPANVGANKCLFPNSSLGFAYTSGNCYRICFWAAQFNPASPNNAALTSIFNFEYEDSFGVLSPGVASNFSIAPTATSTSGSFQSISWTLPASTNVKTTTGATYTGAAGQVVDWKTLNWQYICLDFTPAVTSDRMRIYLSTTNTNNGVAIDGICATACSSSATCAIKATATPGACNSATNGYTVSGTISLTAHTTAGTATITDGTKSTTISVPAGATAVAYSLTGLTSGTGSHTVTVSLPGCGTATATYSAPASCTVACTLAITANASSCDPATNKYSVTGQLTFTNAPSAGVLRVRIPGKGYQDFTAPFTSPLSYSIGGLNSDGQTGTVIATFSNGTCSATAGYTAPVLCLPSVCVSPQTGGVESYSYAIPLTTTNWTQAMPLPKFDTQGGTRVLKSVLFTVNQSIRNWGVAESQDTEATEVNIETTGTTSFSLNGVAFVSNVFAATNYPKTVSAAVLVPATGSWPGDNTAPTFPSTLLAMPFVTTALNSLTDPTLSPSWVTNVTGDPTDDDDMTYFAPVFSDGSKSFSYSATADLANFIGTGNLDLRANARGASLVSGAGNLVTQIRTAADAVATVTYVYCDVPLVCSLTATATPGTCNSATNQYSVSGTISLTNNVTGGTATVTDGTKTATVTVPAGATTVAYSLTGLTSGTGSHTVTVSLPGCGTATAMYVAPASCTVAPCSTSATAQATCNNNGTLDVTSDDFINILLTPYSNVQGSRFTLTATQNGNPVSLSLSDGSSFTALSYAYPKPLRAPVGSAGNGNIILTLTDVTNTTCITQVTVVDPGECAAAACVGATPQTVTNTYRTPFQPTELNSVPLLLPKFDDGGGTRTLTGVKLTYGMFEATNLLFENTAATPSVFRPTVTADIFIDLGATNLSTETTTATPGSQTAPASITVAAQGTYGGDVLYGPLPTQRLSTLFGMGSWLDDVMIDIYSDPRLDSRWVTNATGNPTTDDDMYVMPPLSLTFSGTNSYTATGDLTQFIGTGQIPLTASTLNGLTLSGGGGNLIYKQWTKAYAYATVEYTYICNSCTLVATATPGNCDPVTNRYAVTGTVSLTNNLAGGTATITDGVKSTTVTVPAGATSVAYSLTGLTSGTGSHTVTVSLPGCGTATATYNAPASCSVDCATLNAGPDQDLSCNSSAGIRATSVLRPSIPGGTWTASSANIRFYDSNDTTFAFVDSPGTYTLTYSLPGGCSDQVVITFQQLAPTCNNLWDSMTGVLSLYGSSTATTLYKSASYPGSLGGETDLSFQFLSGLALSGNGAALEAGNFEWSNGPGRYSKVVISWDGVDNSAAALNPTGLGGLNFSGAGNFGFVINAVDIARFKVTLRLYTDANRVSESYFSMDQPGNLNSNIPVEFTTFTATVGSGADLSNIGAIELIFEPINLLSTANGIDLNATCFHTPCLIPCAVATTATASTCNPATNQYTVSGTISLTSATAGTATITDGAKSTTVTVPAGATSVAYSLTGLTSGTGSHTVTVSLPGCATATAIYNAPASCSVAATINVTSATVCYGNSATLTASGCVGTVAWSNGTTGTTLVTPALTQTTSYTATCTTASATTFALGTVTVLPQPVLNLSASATLVTVGANVTLTAAGCAGTVAWSNGSTGASIVVTPTQPTQTYSATCTTGPACFTTASIVVNTEAPASLVVSSATVCHGSSATLTAAGCTGSVTWSNGTTGNTLVTSALTQTTNYTATCTTATSTTFAVGTVTVNPAVTATISAANLSICAGQSTTLTASGGASYLWSNGATTATISVSTAGTYSVTATSAAGCSGTATTTVVQNPAPVVTVTSATVCAGSSATLTASGAATYLWSTGATTPGIVVSATATTTYSVTGTSSAGCSATATGTVTVLPLPVINLSASSTLVTAGSNVTLTATGCTGSVAWSNGSTGASIVVMPMQATQTYSATCTTGPSCFTTASIVVNTEAPASLVVSSATICSGSSATLTAAGCTGTVTWSNGTTGNTLVTPALTQTTNYTATCTTATSTTFAVGTVTVNPAVTATISSAGVSGSLSICAGQSTTLTASGGASYQWNNGATTATISVSAAGTYSVTAISAAGCSGTATTTVVQNPTPVVTVTSATVCAGESTTLTASGAATYRWSTGATTQSIVVSATATTTYSVTGTSSAGCSATATGTVTVNGQPQIISVNQSTICVGNVASLTVNATSTGSGVLEYSLNGGAFQTANSFTLNAPVSTTAVIVVRTQGSSCTATESIVVNCACQTPVSLTFVPTALQTCPEVPVSFTVGVAGATSASLTSSGTGTFSQSVVSGMATVTYLPSLADATAGSVTLTLTSADPDGTGTCVADQVSRVLTINPAPVVTVTSASICAGEMATLTATGADTYLWSNGATTQTISVSVAGTYSVTGTTAAGCSATATGTLTVFGQPTISPAILPAATVGVAYSQTLTGNGGRAPYTFAVVAGSLPQGLSLSTGGVLAGTPTDNTPASFTVSLTDANGCTAVQPYSTTAIGLPKLELNKLVSKRQAQVGEVVSFTVLLANTGLASATGVVVSDTHTAGLSLLPGSVTVSAGSFTPGLNGGQWAIASLPAGATATLTYSASITGEGLVYNTASIPGVPTTDVKTCLTVPMQVCQGEPFAIKVNAPEGYSRYQWYLTAPGATTSTLVADGTLNSFTATLPGSYSVLIDSGLANTCPSQGCCPIVIEEVAVPSYTALVKNSSCVGSTPQADGQITLVNLGTAGRYYYQVSPGTSFNPAQAGAVAAIPANGVVSTGLLPGNYTVRVWLMINGQPACPRDLTVAVVESCACPTNVCVPVVVRKIK